MEAVVAASVADVIVAEGVIVTSAVLLVATLAEDGSRGLSMACTKDQSWLERLGMLDFGLWQEREDVG